MRRVGEQGVWRGEKWVTSLQWWLGVENIDASAAKTAFVECCCEGVDIDDRTAGAVDEDGGWFHFVDLFFADEAAGLVVHGEMNADDVAGGHQACRDQQR